MTSLAQLERDGRIAVKDWSQHDWRRYAETARYVLVRQGYRDDDAEEWSDAGMVTVMELWRGRMVSPQRARRDVLMATYAARNAETTRLETAAADLPENVGDRLELRLPERPAAAAARTIAEKRELRDLTRQYAGLGAAIIGSLYEVSDRHMALIHGI